MAEESIYNIVYEEPAAPVRPPIYKSQFPGTSAPTSSTFGLKGTPYVVKNACGDLNAKAPKGSMKASGTFGAAPTAAMPDPSEFVKMSDKKVATLKQMTKTNPDALKPSKLKTKVKPPLPGPDDKPIMNLVSSKNYIVANAVEAILAAPKTVPNDDMDFLSKEDYGKVPPYLTKIKEDISAEYEYIRQLREEAEMASMSHRAMTAEERETLIQGLKAKWEEVNREYQETSHLTKLDTIGKMKRKVHNENMLNEIEKSIEKMKRQNIMIDLSA